MSDYTTYAEAIKAAMYSPEYADSVVMTGGYDEDIVDHYNGGANEDDREVYVEEQVIQRDTGTAFEEAQALIIREVDRRGYIETGERWAAIISHEDYDRLGY